MSKKATVAKNNQEKIYEIGYHLISSIAEENVPAEVDKIKGYLSKESASIILEESPKLRPLTYNIKKGFGGIYKTYDKAYFGFIKFELPEGSDIKTIDLGLKNNESVLRYIVVKTVRESTMYSPKISVFTDKEIKPKVFKEEKIEKPASVEEMDKSIDALVSDEEVVAEL